MYCISKGNLIRDMALGTHGCRRGGQPTGSSSPDRRFLPGRLSIQTPELPGRGSGCRAEGQQDGGALPPGIV